MYSFFYTIYIYIHVYIYIYTYIYIHVYIYIYTHAYTYIHTYIHTHRHTYITIPYHTISYHIVSYKCMICGGCLKMGHVAPKRKLEVLNHEYTPKYVLGPLCLFSSSYIYIYMVTPPMTPLSASYIKKHWKNSVFITYTASKMRPKNT